MPNSKSTLTATPEGQGPGDGCSFFRDSALTAACQRVKQSGGALHLIGAIPCANDADDGGRLHSCLDLAQRQGITEVYVHAFVGVHDATPEDGAAQMEKLEESMRRSGCGRVASVTGRSYSVEDEKNWNRASLFYATVVRGEGFRNASGVEAVSAAYAHGESDESMMPVVIVTESGQPVGRVKDGDAVVFFDLRADRFRRMAQALATGDLGDLDGDPVPQLSAFLTLSPG